MIARPEISAEGTPGGGDHGTGDPLAALRGRVPRTGRARARNRL